MSPHSLQDQRPDPGDGGNRAYEDNSMSILYPQQHLKTGCRGPNWLVMKLRAWRVGKKKHTNKKLLFVSTMLTRRTFMGKNHLSLWMMADLILLDYFSTMPACKFQQQSKSSKLLRLLFWLLFYLLITGINIVSYIHILEIKKTFLIVY